MGAFSLDAKVLSNIAASNASKRIDTVVDYDHASVFGGSSRAAGWVRALDARGNELHAQIEWTDSAKSAIAAGEYKYLSPTILLKTKDRVSGKDGPPSLHSVALTNVPFLHELPSVQLNNLLVEEDDMELQTVVCQQLGVAADTSVDAIKAMLIDLTDPARSAEAVKALRDEVSSLKAELSKRDADALVEKAFSEGKLIECQREWARSYAETSPDGFKAWALNAPPIVPLKKVERDPEVSKKQDNTVALSDEQKRINALLGVSDDEFVKYNKD